MGNMNVTVIDQNNVKIAVTPTPTQTISIDRGLIGPQGISGFSGYSGFSGMSGYSGSGISGYSGYSGQQGTSITVKGEVATVEDLPPTGNQVNDAYIVTADGNLWVWNGTAWYDAGQIVGPQGLSGFSGYSGFSGESGYSGFSGISGYSGSGVSGYSGDSGISGYSGWSGESGYSGISGFSGDSGISGFSGDSGISGYSGYSGISGYSGSGVSGWSGESGYSGYSGISGYSGYSGEVGISGFSGFSGYSGAVGESGYSGISGYSGFSGQDGASGTSGYSGYSGYSGAVGTSGFSGISGWSGFSGISGYSGYSGAIGQSSSLFTYYAEAVQTSGQPATGYLLWNTATQSNATQININHLTNDGSDIDIFLALLQPTQKFTIQDQNVSGNYQSWLITGTPTNINPNTSNSYWTVPVSLISSGGTGTTDFADNHPLFLAITAGVSGTSGYSGYSGFSGISGFSGWSGISGYSGASGISGENGASGFSGTSGFSGISGYSGFSGISGQDGASGYSGFSGISGTNGASGFSGISGYSGYSGIDGASGFSGYSGVSGYSGSGVSGYSGFSGISGYSGYSGITPAIGGSNTQVQYNNSGVLDGNTKLTYDGSNLTVGVIGLSANADGATGKLVLRKPNEALGNNQITRMLDFAPYYSGYDEAVIKASIFSGVDTGTQNGQLGFMVATGGVLYEKIRLLANGNLGIGTSSPSQLLHINVSSGNVYEQISSGANNVYVGFDSARTVGTIQSNNALTFDVGSSYTERMRIDSSGNLGIGVTPSAWGSNYKAIQIGAQTCLYNAVGYVTSLNTNAYEDSVGALLRIAAGEATRYTQAGGVHAWFNAPNGSAGAVATFTQAMTLTASGNLGIGTTDPDYGSYGATERILGVTGVATNRGRLSLQNTSTGSSGVAGTVAFFNGSTLLASLDVNADGATNKGLYAFNTNNGTSVSERMRITNTGNVGIGTSSPAAKLQVNADTDTIKTYGTYYNQVIVDCGSGGFSQAVWQIVGASKALVGAGGGNMVINTAGDSTANMIFSTGSGTTERMRIDSSGNLLVGTTTSSLTSGDGFVFTPDTNGSGAKTGYASNTQTCWNMYSTGVSAYRFYVGWGGTIFATSIVISAISDERLKENIRDIDTGLSTIMALKPRRFDWKEGKGQDKKNAAGFIAQEYQKVLPNSISTFKQGDDGIDYLTMNHEELIPTLTKAIQEQQALIESLTTRLTALENK